MNLKNVVLSMMILLSASVCHASGPRMLAFYELRFAKQPPKIDGNLDDPCWRQADRSSMYYEYHKANPGPGRLKTDLRMVYDDNGVYLAITNYDDQISKIRAERKRQDDPSLWRDDCAEIYFDPAGASIGFVKFVVNPIGTKADMKRVDAAVTMGDWNGTAWAAKIGKQPNAWIIEAFFPWSDLGKKAKAGDLWRFDHVRYAYSTGKFIGVTWSPGGGYSSPENFGFIYFGGEKPLAPKALGALLATRVPPPWRLAISSGFVDCSGKDTVRFQIAEGIANKAREKVAALLRQTEEKLAKLKNDTRWKKMNAEQIRLRTAYQQLLKTKLTMQNTLGMLQDYEALGRKIEELFWKARIAELLHTLQTGA